MNQSADNSNRPPHPDEFHDDEETVEAELVVDEKSMSIGVVSELPDKTLVYTRTGGKIPRGGKPIHKGHVREDIAKGMVDARDRWLRQRQ